MKKELIFYGMLLLAFILIVKKLFGSIGKGLGIGEPSKQEKKTSESEIMKSTAISEAIKAKPKTGKKIVQLFPQKKINADADKIYNSLGDFTLDDDLQVIGILETYKYQSQISQLAERFQQRWKKSFRAFLAEYLSEKSLEQINKNIETLPTGITFSK